MRARFKELLLLATSRISVDTSASPADLNGKYWGIAKFSCADFVQRYSTEIAIKGVPGRDQNSLYTSAFIEIYYYIAG